MAKFDAGKEVERLEYDFTDYGGGAGPINEPTTGRVNSFFANSKALINEVRKMKGMAEGLQDINLEEMSDEESLDVLSKVDEASTGAELLQKRTVENLALLCGAEWVHPEDEEQDPYLEGGSPSHEELSNLPYRVLQAFSQWLVEQIQPKKRTPGSKR